MTNAFIYTGWIISILQLKVISNQERICGKFNPVLVCGCGWWGDVYGRLLDMLMGHDPSAGSYGGCPKGNLGLVWRPAKYLYV